MLAEEAVDAIGPPIENHIDVVITRFPRIAEDLAAFCFEARADGIAQPIESLPQRRSPFLIPAGMAAGVAATIAVPSFHAVRATPCRAFPDLGFMRGGMLRKEFAVVGEF